jgi:hypothetical protein
MRKTLILGVALVLSTSAFALMPFQEGHRDYYAGLCFRARPYLDGPAAKEAAWIKGFNDAQAHDKRHCKPQTYRAVCGCEQ